MARSRKSTTATISSLEWGTFVVSPRKAEAGLTIGWFDESEDDQKLIVFSMMSLSHRHGSPLVPCGSLDRQLCTQGR